MMVPYNRWRMCERKKGYETESKANKAHSKHCKDYNDLHVYECPFCFMWHLGHKLKNEKRVKADD